MIGQFFGALLERLARILKGEAVAASSHPESIVRVKLSITSIDLISIEIPYDAPFL